MHTFIPPPILPAVLAVVEHDEYFDLWQAKVASVDNDDVAQSKKLYDDSSDESIHLFGDERDRSFKHCDGVSSTGARKRFATAVDAITATKLSLSKKHDSSVAAFRMRPAKAARSNEPKFSEWMGRIDRDSHEDYVLALNMEKRGKALQNRLKNYRPGSSVSTRNKKVATDEVSGERKKGSHRDKVFGILIKTSPIDEAYWLVKFYNNKLYYCVNTVLKFEDHQGDERVLSHNQLAMMKNARYEHLEVEHENILKRVLFPLPVKLPATSAISVEGIVRRLKAFHPWLAESDLRLFIETFQ